MGLPDHLVYYFALHLVQVEGDDSVTGMIPTLCAANHSCIVGSMPLICVDHFGFKVCEARDTICQLPYARCRFQGLSLARICKVAE